jgi:hypothetical protein
MPPQPGRRRRPADEGKASFLGPPPGGIFKIPLSPGAACAGPASAVPLATRISAGGDADGAARFETSVWVRRFVVARSMWARPYSKCASLWLWALQCRVILSAVGGPPFPCGSL